MSIIISNASLSNIEFNSSTNEITNLPTAGVIDGNIIISTITENLELFLDVESYSGTGTTWTDSSGNGNDGTLVGGPTFNTESDYSYFSLDGVNDYFSTSFKPNLNNKRLYTYELWFRDFNSGVSGGITSLIGNYGPSSTFPYSMLSIDNNAVVTFAERSNNGSKSTISPSSVATGNWIHIVAVADSNSLHIYLDGTQVASASTRPGGVITSTMGFVLGGAHYDTSRVQSADFALFRVYIDKALSSSEVLQNYNAEKSKFGHV